MAQGHDYIPKADGDLVIFTKNLYDYALANHERWGVPTPEEELATPLAKFEAALVVFNNPNRGKVDTANKNDAKKILVSALRTYVQGFIARNPRVSAEDKRKMSLSPRDGSPTPRPTPETRPVTEAVPTGRGIHDVTAINPQTNNKDKPEFVSGVAFARRVRNPEDPVSRADDMPSFFQTGTTRTFQYTQDDYGKMVDYATAYENPSGKRGPWSNVTSLLISG